MSKTIAAAFVIVVVCVRVCGAQTPAFPSAQGFGALATGGRAGVVYLVTTLADSGPGSFREAVSKPGRIVVFNIGGVIRLHSEAAIASNITIAGQSAPGDGICVYGRSVSLSGQKNIIIRYMRFREGISGSKGKCSIDMAGAHNVILDHCSIEWGRWDCLGLTENSSDVTIQYCIIGQGIAPQRFGALIDSATHVTLSHDLWIHNQSRSPKAKGTIQDINNVVYDWGVTGLAGGHSGAKHELDAIGDYLIKGPASNDHAIGEFTATDQVYQTGNLVDLNRDGSLNGRPVVERDFSDSKGSPTFLREPSLKPPVPVTVDDAAAAYEKVVATAGASLHRDSVDGQLIDEVRSLGKQGAIRMSEADVGGQGDLRSGVCAASTAGDGIPDAWKVAHGLKTTDAGLYRTPASLPSSVGSIGAETSGDRLGYTVLEVYLNGLCGDGD